MIPIFKRAQAVANALKAHEKALADLPAEHSAHATVKVVHDELFKTARWFGLPVSEVPGPEVIAFSGGGSKNDDPPPPPPPGGN